MQQSVHFSAYPGAGLRRQTTRQGGSGVLLSRVVGNPAAFPRPDEMCSTGICLLQALLPFRHAGKYKGREGDTHITQTQRLLTDGEGKNLDCLLNQKFGSHFRPPLSGPLLVNSSLRFCDSFSVSRMGVKAICR